MLAAHVPSSAITFCAADQPAKVAELLSQTSIGFIVRRPGIVNEVSFPTKFGEYVASGVPIVATAIGWEIGTIIDETGAGQTLPWSGNPLEMGHVITTMLDPLLHRPTVSQSCARATDLLDRGTWVDRLTDHLSSLR